MDKVTGSRIATPSLATSSVSSLSNILSLIQDEQRGHNGQVWMDVDNMNLKCTSEYDEVQSEIQSVGKCGATCITLQLLDVKTKCHPAVHQKFVGSARFKSAERKGVVINNDAYHIVKISVASDSVLHIMRGRFGIFYNVRAHLLTRHADFVNQYNLHLYVTLPA